VGSAYRAEARCRNYAELEAVFPVRNFDLTES
jgi:hypothetical protein